MKSLRIPIFLVSLIAPTLSAAEVERVKMPITSTHGVALEPATLERLKIEGLDGSGEAARRVANHYFLSEINVDESLYWAVISAENGSIGGQYLAGFLLKDMPGGRCQRRAIFWLQKAADQGSETAKSLLRELRSKHVQ